MLINLDNISHIRIIENKNNLFEIFVYAYNSQWIGDYSTKEKAIKVLDMIQEEYLKPIYQNFIDENEVAIYKNKVFQMPQDSEV